MSVLTKEQAEGWAQLGARECYLRAGADAIADLLETVRARDSEIERLNRENNRLIGDAQRVLDEVRGIHKEDKERLAAEVKRKDEALAKAVNLCETYSADWAAQIDRRFTDTGRAYADGASRVLQEMASKIAALAPQPAPSEQPAKIKRNMSTAEAREFWRKAEETAAEVAKWPGWKRAGINTAQTRDEIQTEDVTLSSQFDEANALVGTMQCVLENTRVEYNRMAQELEAQRAEWERNAERVKLLDEALIAAVEVLPSRQARDNWEVAIEAVRAHDARAKGGGE